MIPHSLGGAVPRRADQQQRQGPVPQPSAAARERLRELGELFTARIEQSMVDSLAALTEDAGEGSGEAGEEGSPFGDMGAAFGASSLGSARAAQAGAGSEAALARQLLAAASAVGMGSASGSAGVGGASAAATTASPAGAGDVRANARVVAQVAREQGVDPVAAVAMMLVESGGNAGAIGDGGTSFGLFQLHEGGMLTAAGLTPQQAYEPRTNATVSLRALAHETRKGPNRSPGEIAAASQRPADPADYARKVDAAMERARALLR